MRAILVVLGAVMLAGCRAGDPVALWKDAVEQFVRDSGAGDLSALQSAGESHAADELRPALATVSVRGIWATDVNPAKFRDAHGVLVGLAQAGARPWYVFALGICESAQAGGQSAPVRQRVVDVRVAAISGGPDRFEWRSAEPASTQLSRYLASEPPEWPAMDVHWSFPRAADDFTLTTGETGVQVIERRTGARWKLALLAE